MKPVRAISVLPTLFTLGNLVCGFFAIVVAARIEKPGVIEFVPAAKLGADWPFFDSGDPTHNLMFCGSLIFLAMLCDMFDGQVARLTRTTSDFGGQLDSLCDVVSFGVAPAILAKALIQHEGPLLGYELSPRLSFAACACYAATAPLAALVVTSAHPPSRGGRPIRPTCSRSASTADARSAAQTAC